MAPTISASLSFFFLFFSFWHRVVCVDLSLNVADLELVCMPGAVSHSSPRAIRYVVFKDAFPLAKDTRSAPTGFVNVTASKEDCVQNTACVVPSPFAATVGETCFARCEFLFLVFSFFQPSLRVCRQRVRSHR